MTEDRARALLRRIRDLGCPAYRDTSGSRTRNGCACCAFCDANLELGEPHDPQCAWLELLRIVEGT
jgi:hypothetical protein